MNLISPIQESFSSIKQNKTRSVLAGFGVAWGIFILILLLGAGNGFQEGILQLFSSFAKNSMFIYGGHVSEKKLDKSIQHKKILFNDLDVKIINERYPEIEFISPEVIFRGNSLTIYEQNAAYPQIKGILPDYFNVKIIKPEKGRLINTLDNKEYRRVALIGKQVSNQLFPDEEPLGKEINIAGSFFTIVGVIEKGSLFTQNEQSVIYIPYNTFNDCLTPTIEYNSLVLTLAKKTDATAFENKIKTFLGKRKGFNKEDKKAIFILNFENQVKMFDKLFKGINLFLWIIGLCFLLSGIVGIGNIMLVIVKERTHEIGIRKAIGAESSSIVRMIITESIVITSMAGIIGLVVGGGVIGILNWVIESFFTDKDSLFTEASIDYAVIIFSLSILMLSGIIAGFIPAKKAASITPVEAIRN
ncbi:ABC transporter permease [Halosquirtibacter laminarini]|uniref:ABC transporter permease n=1 Tax=Halosquirtibacter laminarini TaxID=3374600 RepID=A0AC61NP69_9BACT|nr:ABC transporter permease [Prolixibacteraceae bacterium]